jgi:type I restriction enzyme M protein
MQTVNENQAAHRTNLLTGEIRSQIDAIWNAFWTGGISNPLEVIEQITYLLFLKRLDDLQTLEELKSQRLKKPIERRIFPEGKDLKKMPYDQFRWSKFKNLEAREMYTTVSDHVFRSCGRWAETNPPTLTT